MFYHSFLACQEEVRTQESKPVSQKITVSLKPQMGGEVKIPLRELKNLIPQAVRLTDIQKERLWSVLHLMVSPCESEDMQSVLFSLKEKKCKGSNILLQRALRNINADDKVLLEETTVSDFWFADAQQGKEFVTVELWMDVNSPAEELIEKTLNKLHSANVRVCLRTQRYQIIDNKSLPYGHKLSDSMPVELKDAKLDSCSTAIDAAVRSSPTWFVEGFRLRGLQSSTSIQRLISLSNQDRIKDGN